MSFAGSDPDVFARVVQQMHFDLSPDAFTTLANIQCGVIKLNYRAVACPVSGNLQVKIDCALAFATYSRCLLNTMCLCAQLAVTRTGLGSTSSMSRARARLPRCEIIIVELPK